MFPVNSASEWQKVVEGFVLTLSKQLAQFIPKLFAGLLIFAAFWFGSWLLRTILLKAGRRSRIEQRIINLFSRLIGATGIIFGSVTALGTMGVNVGALIAGIGLSSFALGFAFKDALSNALAGILIIIYRPFRVGDKISVTGLEGMIEDIDLRYTVLSAEEKKILIPNANLFANTVIVFHEPSSFPVHH